MLRKFLLLLLVTLCAPAAAFAPSHRPVSAASTSYAGMDTRKHFDLGSMISNFGKKVTVSHILIGPPESKTGRGMEQSAAQAKLLELKADIGNDPDKFAEAARQFSSCRSSMKQGGDLGEFGPGLLVKSIDKVCFEEEVGVVHGPISSPFGEHLVLVRERTG